MSELIKTRAGNGNIRLGFLAGASTLTLLSAIWASQSAASDQEDRPPVWIELGGQLERVSGANNPFSPAFLTKNSDAAIFEATSPLEAQHLPRYSIGEEAKISFQPKKSDWAFAASLRYGRSNGSKDFEYQTKGFMGERHIFLSQPPISFTAGARSFSEVQTQQQESHLILDFQAGRDVGLGLMGAISNINVGVRFAQFTSKAVVNLHARPDVELYQTHAFPGNPAKYGSKTRFHAYTVAAHSVRSFHGIGSSLSWNGSVPLMGGERDTNLDLDLGVNGAVLFGRQKAIVEHQTTARHFKQSYYRTVPGRFRTFYNTQYRHNIAHARSRSVTVPNIGAFAGVSYRAESFKMSAGYRADFFFGAVDTGIDASDRATTSFHGPFATISLGLGG